MIHELKVEPYTFDPHHDKDSEIAVIATIATFYAVDGAQGDDV